MRYLLSLFLFVSFSFSTTMYKGMCIDNYEIWNEWNSNPSGGLILIRPSSPLYSESYITYTEDIINILVHNEGKFFFDSSDSNYQNRCLPLSVADNYPNANISTSTASSGSGFDQDFLYGLSGLICGALIALILLNKAT